MDLSVPVAPSWYAPRPRALASLRFPGIRLGLLAVELHLITAGLLLAPWTARADDAVEAAAEHFDREVAPLLARHCLECHNASDRKGGLDLATAEGAQRGGDSGPALTAPPDGSPLLSQRIASGEMPPERTLADADRQTLLAWIERGAAWGGPIDRFRYSSDSRAGYDWWSLQPPTPPRVPASARDAAEQSPVDAFVSTKLRAAGIVPNTEADRRTLIRRLAFDLWGLPPAPEDVALFVADDGPEAYARLVDRMLAAPHYGERWARHWLDVARYGESQGFEYDKLRPTAFHYRDWVIRALNEDLPYDEFIRRQIAGDVLAPDDPQGVIATGFLVAGPWDQAGQMQQSAAMRAVVRQDELEDIIGVTSQAVLGLTAHCARCHDHKFDPITQVDYYELAAALAGVAHGERPLSGEYLATDAAALQRQRRAVAQQLADQIQAARRSEGAPAEASAAIVAPPEPRLTWDFTRDRAEVDPQGRVALHGGAVWDAAGLHVASPERFATVPLEFNLETKTLEAWVRLDNLEQQGGAPIGIESAAKSAFDAIVFGERAAGQWMAGSEGFARTRDLEAEPETADASQVIHVAVTYAADGEVCIYRHGRPYGRPYTVSPPVRFETGQAHVLFGLRHHPLGSNKLLSGTIVRAALYDRALSSAEISRSASREPTWYDPQAALDTLTTEQRREREELVRELAHLDDQRRRATTAKVYANAPKEPAAPTTVLARGNPAQPGATVAAGGVRSLGTAQAEWGLSPDAPEAERRRRLAQWLTGPKNPLPARVIVNRLWQHHFGVGLVDTPNDFGYSGGRPSHPELLDWLACELVDSGWRLKHVQRLILNSQAYRRAAAMRPEAMALDADNRLLWRSGPRRLEAESLRDALLAVSGQLNPSMGGPGFHDFRAYERSGTQFYEPWDAKGPSFQRRSVYRTWARSGRNPLLDALDCPDPSTTTPRRAATTTPLQALALLNQSFVLRAAEALAQRATQRIADDTAAQIALVYAWALQRAPDDEERPLAAEHAAAHGLPALCRVLLNTSEFLYVD